jgi:hypothetical protein
MLTYFLFLFCFQLISSRPIFRPFNDEINLIGLGNKHSFSHEKNGLFTKFHYEVEHKHEEHEMWHLDHDLEVTKTTLF